MTEPVRSVRVRLVARADLVGPDELWALTFGAASVLGTLFGAWIYVQLKALL